MSMTVGQILTILGGWSVVVSGLVVFANKLLTERLLAKWKRVEEERLEAVKAQLGHDRVMLETAIKGQQLGQDATQQSRLKACEDLWRTTVLMRTDYGSATLFFEILLPSEYQKAVNEDVMGSSLLNRAWLTEKIEATKNLEYSRPYLGEVLWALFFIYRAVLSRLVVLIQAGVAGRPMLDWRKDKGIKQMLTALPSKKLDVYLEDQNPRALRATLNALEYAILEEIGQIVSGKRSSNASLAQAQEARTALSVATSPLGEVR